MTDPNILTPLDVLIAHQRRDVASCICGWSELGASHCQHQLDELALAGYTVVPIWPTEDA